MKCLFVREYSIGVYHRKELGKFRCGLALCRGHKEYCV